MPCWLVFYQLPLTFLLTPRWPPLSLQRVTAAVLSLWWRVNTWVRVIAESMIRWWLFKKSYWEHSKWLVVFRTVRFVWVCICAHLNLSKCSPECLAAHVMLFLYFLGDVRCINSATAKYLICSFVIHVLSFLSPWLHPIPFCLFSPPSLSSHLCL